MIKVSKHMRLNPSIYFYSNNAIQCHKYTVDIEHKHRNMIHCATYLYIYLTTNFCSIVLCIYNSNSCSKHLQILLSPIFQAHLLSELLLPFQNSYRHLLSENMQNSGLQYQRKFYKWCIFASGNNLFNIQCINVPLQESSNLS